MFVLFKIIGIACLPVIFLQDFKDRQVSILLLCISFFSFAAIHLLNSTWEGFLVSIAFNLLLLVMIIILLYTYVKIIRKRALKDAIGAGDIFFFSIMAVGFPTVTFVYLFATSLLFSLVIFYIFKRNLKSPLIPLAGFQALFLFIVMVFNTCFDFSNLYLI